MPEFRTNARIGVPYQHAPDDAVRLLMAPFVVSVAEAELEAPEGEEWSEGAGHAVPLPDGWRPALWEHTGIRPTAAFVAEEVRPDGTARGPLVVAVFSLN